MFFNQIDSKQQTTNNIISCSSFQNAMRAVVEFHRDKMELPKLKIIVAKGQQDLTIKVF